MAVIDPISVPDTLGDWYNVTGERAGPTRFVYRKGGFQTGPGDTRCSNVVCASRTYIM